MSTSTDRRTFLASLAALWSYVSTGKAPACPAQPQTATAPLPHGFSRLWTGVHCEVVDKALAEAMQEGKAWGWDKGWYHPPASYKGTRIWFYELTLHISGDEVFKFDYQNKRWFKAGQEWWLVIPLENETHLPLEFSHEKEKETT